MNRLLLVVLLAIVGGGLIAGFMVAGGPGYARMERYDNERAADLRTLGDYHRCVLEREEDSEGSNAPRYCSGFEQAPELTDPASGAPYRFTRLGPQAFKVCANFQTEALREASDRRYSQLVFEGDEGCVIYGQGTGAEAPDATLKWTTE
ncbi:hypothetical protein O4H53_20200 [Sulfitobacter sp. G21635-S1]|uniref:hypothetical protein n=1 Tax=Sulfitobacter sp. G21635-S1 TaxID=3014043 RepID=UPI0022AFD32C|nr:hypothetical protein [Sulfitobacter sp. G21635-S1]MCZ4257877.1 hypothetical protein [Sulfitobacter sp. G21635-S1]